MFEPSLTSSPSLPMHCWTLHYRYVARHILYCQASGDFAWRCSHDGFVVQWHRLGFNKQPNRKSTHAFEQEEMSPLMMQFFCFSNHCYDKGLRYTSLAVTCPDD